VTNNKKLLFLFIIIIISFILVFFFPSIGSKIRTQFFYSKDIAYKPVKSLINNTQYYFDILKTNNNYIDEVKKLEKEIFNLKSINSMLVISLSKFNELNYTLFETLEDSPKSVGVSIIGNKNHLFRDLFIIDKGYSSGISTGNYVTSDNKIIGRIKTVNYNSSEVVGVLNFDYGDEVLINEKSYIISGNNTELIFIRQKDSTEELNLIVGDIAKIKIGNHYIKIGIVDLLDNKFVIKTKLITSYSTARVIIGD
jgi:cell shape-determining protein MreC